MPLLDRLPVRVKSYLAGAAAILPWLGGVLLLVAAAFALHSWSFVRTQQRATATVTEDVAVIVPKEGVLYSPRLRFRSVDGAQAQVVAQPGSSEIEFAAGDTVPVLYPAGHPERAIVGTAWRMYPAAIVLAVLGVVLFDVGFLLRVVMRKK